MQKKNIEEIFRIWHRENPAPKTELIYVNNYTLLVAVILSAQSTDIGVNKATKPLFEIANSPQKMIDLGELQLKKYINTIGLYNNKAKNLIAMSKMLLKDFNGEVPQNLEQLQSLAGVGRKTANVILNCAFGEKRIAVDTHVFRVSNRIGFVCENNVLDTEFSLMKKIPSKWQQHAHHWMILHGRYICTARKPKCSECKISKFCEFKQKLPLKKGSEQILK